MKFFLLFQFVFLFSNAKPVRNKLDVLEATRLFILVRKTIPLMIKLNFLLSNDEIERTIEKYIDVYNQKYLDSRFAAQNMMSRANVEDLLQGISVKVNNLFITYGIKVDESLDYNVVNLGNENMIDFVEKSSEIIAKLYSGLENEVYIARNKQKIELSNRREIPIAIHSPDLCNLVFFLQLLESMNLIQANNFCSFCSTRIPREENCYLKCNHVLHKDCFLRLENNKCPKCAKTVLRNHQRRVQSISIDDDI
jgi:hypothetical protein